MFEKKWAISRLKAHRVGINDFKAERVFVSNGFKSEDEAISYLNRNGNTTMHYEIYPYYQVKK